MGIGLCWMAVLLALSSQAAPALDELETTSTSVALSSSTTTLVLDDNTLSTTSVSQQTLMNGTSLTAMSVSTTLNGRNGQEESQALTWPPPPSPPPSNWPSSSTTKTTTTSTTTTEVTTSRLDAESSAESFESGEATSVASASTYQRPLVDSQVSSSSSTWTTAGIWTKSPVTWPWMLFVLNGNADVANRRQRDLGTYLRLNLAARLDADYNDVAINRILLTPMAILANISVEPSHLEYGGTGAAGLEALGQGNVTLLELSGHEFQVDRIIRFDEIADQRTMMSGMEMSSMTAATVSSSEVTVYGAVGAIFLFLLVALLLGLSFSSPCKAGDDGKYLPSTNGYDRDQMDGDDRLVIPSEWKNSPPVIYTEQLAKQIGAGVLTRGHFIPSRAGHSTTHGNNTTTLAELHHPSADQSQHQPMTINQTSQ